ncbi:helix-turn-helix domain-containing protein [Lapidilactobacillus bayanensis]|uniref:helix-turn-helix domain-containing protein n=1 Tax=Lapidilactobacillus bayanensis TaxID=2485998 RepID=UPI001CDD707A|nr:helix-turn-helix transcriptional regulator [Lapidilactobacillus bayanensis]
MMNIEVFTKQRKAMKMSQTKIAAGICTQATVSKFENNGKVPSLNILNQLCTRIGLTVDDLYSDPEVSVVALRHQLDDIEDALMREDYRFAVKELNNVESDKIEASLYQMQFYYLQGMVRTLTNQKLADILFDFSRILDDLDEKHQTIFTQLAYLGSGILYLRHREEARAKFFFNKVIDYLAQPISIPDRDDEKKFYLRRLTLIFFSAEFLSNQECFAESEQLINSGVQLCADEHLTYYLARLKFLALSNAITTKQSNELVQRLYQETLAFARLNHDVVTELKTAPLMKQWQEAVIK